MTRKQWAGYRVSRVIVGALIVAPLSLTSCQAPDGADENAGAPVTEAALVPSAPGPAGTLVVSRPIRKGSGVAPALSTPSQYPLYYEGPIIQPELVTLYWGTFSAGTVNTTQTYLSNLAKHLSGYTAPSGSQPVVSQYGVVGAKLGATFTDASLPGGPIQESDVTAKIASLQQAGQLPAYSPMKVFLVFTSGISFVAVPGFNYGIEWCGYHNGSSFGHYYALVPFPSSPSCASGGFGSFTATQIWQSMMSHEIMEAGTDPLPVSGWYPEIGDDCNWGNSVDNTVAMSFGAVQTMVDRNKASCSIWTNEILAPVSATSPSTNNFDAYALGADQTMYHKALSGTTWTPGRTAAWEQLGTQKFSSQPVTTHWGTQEHIFATGTDGLIYHKSVIGTTWTPSKTTWEKLGGVIYGPPAAVALGTNNVELYGMGTTGEFFHKTLTSTGWVPSTTGWTVVPGGVFNSPPALGTTGSGGIVVVGAGAGDGLYYAATPPNYVWTYLPPAVYPGIHYISAPVIANRSATEYDIVGLGDDFSIYHTHCVGPDVVNSACNTTEPLGGGPFIGVPAAVSWGTSRLDVTALASDGRFWHDTWTSSGWTQFVQQPGTFASSPALVSWGASRLDLFGRGTDAAAYHRSQTNNTWAPASAFESLAGSIH